MAGRRKLGSASLKTGRLIWPCLAGERGPDGRGKWPYAIPTGISIYWCINSQSGDKEKEASKEFLKWLFQSDEGKQIVVNDFGFVPAFNNYDDVEITDPLSKEVKRYIDEGKTLPWVMGGFPSGYEPKAAADFQGYFSGEYTFDQMVDQLKADFVELKK